MEKYTKIGIFTFTQEGYDLAKIIQNEINYCELISTNQYTNCTKVESVSTFLNENFNKYSAFLFIGSLGICVRCISKYISNKKTDPAVVNMDINASFVQSVVSGHIGGANDLTKRVARIFGAQTIITTASDSLDLWSLDTIHKTYNWEIECSTSLTSIIAQFVNNDKTAILIETKDKGTQYIENTKPDFADIFYDIEDIKQEKYELIIAITPYLRKFDTLTLYYRPKVFSLGVGCKKGVNKEIFYHEISNKIKEKNLSIKSIKEIGSINIKKEESAIINLANKLNVTFKTFNTDELNNQPIKNPSDKVFEVTGCYGVAEASAVLLSNNEDLLIEKQIVNLTEGNDFTWALSINRENLRKGFIDIVGAGPGDPELVSVRGKRLLQNADLILYAGSLVPEELTHYAKVGCVVRSSASMDLEEQIQIMKEFYDKGLHIVRLHTGDPCIYGAIQEQMYYFDQYKMDYEITPGISSFLAAAARLRSQFTIPEKTQTIILTRGEGRTPMPEDETLDKLARSQSTMCIFLSATIAEKVQKQLLTHYPEDTPVAICYKLTWKDEKIWRGKLSNLAKIIKDNNLTLTTMIVVGESIDNRRGLSKLYHKSFKHIFRK